MKISIVTISFNQAEFLEACIQSVLSQDYNDKEYIVVDPGSRDSSRTIIERYSDSIDRIILEPDNGPADGLNKGFDLATGEIFGYINADDLLLPGTLSKVAAFFSTTPNIDVICGNGFIVDEKERRQRQIFSTDFNLRWFSYGAATFVQQATFIRRKAFELTGGFNVKNRTCWDAELLVDMAMKGAHFKRIDANLGAFRIHNQSITYMIHSESITVPHGYSATYRDDFKRIYKKIHGKPWNRFYSIKNLIYRFGRVVRYPKKTFIGAIAWCSTLMKSQKANFAMANKAKSSK